MQSKIAAGFGIVAFLFTGSPALAATNLIQNPNFDDGAAHWTLGGFDDTFTGAIADGFAQATTTAHTDGDVKWVHDPVSVEQGGQYTFSDSYESNVPTKIIAALAASTSSSPSLFLTLATVPANPASFTTETQTFTVPFGYSALSVYHVLDTVGNLYTDNYSLMETLDAAHNLPPHGLVSLTFDDGWSSQYDNGFFPLMRTANVPATYYIISNAMADSSHDLFQDSAATGTVVPVTTASSTTWAPIFIDPSSATYFLSSTYTSSAPVDVTVSYNNGAPVTSTFGPLPAGTNVTSGITITLQNPGSINANNGISIKESVTSGSLDISAKSLTEISSDYMTPAQIKILQQAGNEIGDHTLDHCSVTQLEADPSNVLSCAFPPRDNPTSMSKQILDAKTALQSVAPSIDTFAYPYGQFDSGAESFLSSNGFIGARSTTPGYNTLSTDKNALMVQTVDDTTSASTINGWIDFAMSTHQWLILLFHQIDDPAAIASNGEDGGTTPAIFSDVVSHLTTLPSGSVMTVHDALNFIAGVTPPPADTTPPVIDAHADVTAAATSTSGASVTYTNPNATDATPPVDMSCAPLSGSLFAVGTTSVTCTAIDSAPAHNQSTSNFNVIVTPFVVATDTPPSMSAEEAANATQTSVVVSWTTDHPATSRVVYGLDSVSDANATSTGAPNYGYANSTDEDATLSTSHSVTVTGLTANTTYFFRGVSHGSPEAISAEVSAKTQIDNSNQNNGGGSSGGGSSSGGSGSGSGFGNGPIVGSLGTIGGGAVLGASTSTVPSNAITPGNPTGISFRFTHSLGYGSTGTDVSVLQQILIGLGDLQIPAPTGFYGKLTTAAVKKFQADNGIMQLGAVGPKTRAVLNSILDGSYVMPAKQTDAVDGSANVCTSKGC